MAEAAVTEDELSAAQELWREIGKLEGAYPTPEQVLAFMRRCPDAIGVQYAERMLAAAEAQRRCWIAHDGLLDELRITRQELASARRAVDREEQR